MLGVGGVDGEMDRVREMCFAASDQTRCALIY